MWKFLHKLGLHKWSYRNPFDRTCDLCQLRQNQFTNVYDGEHPLYKRGWWETVYPLPPKPE